MIGVQFKRFSGEYKVDCESCGIKINKDQLYFELYFKDIHQTIHICEDCGQDLQNDISNEYCSKFVDLGLTELSPNTLTTVCYGVLDRNVYRDDRLNSSEVTCEIPKWLKRLRLYQ